MEKQETEPIEDIIFNYDVELSRLIDKFYLSFGFSPEEPKLKGEQRQLAKAFWNNKHVAKLECLMEAYCTLLGAN